MTDSSYSALNIDRLVVGQRVNFDVYIKNDHRSKDQSDYVVLFRKGYFIAPAVLSELRDRNLNKIYFRQEDHDTVLEYLKWEPINNNSSETGSKSERGIINEEWSAVKVKSGIIQQDSNYVPLLLDSIAPDKTISFDAFVKGVSTTDSSQEIKYVLYCPSKAQFTAASLAKLRQTGIDKIYYSTNDQTKVLAYLIANIRDLNDNDNLTKEEKAKVVYESTLIWTNNFFTAEKNRVGDQLDMGLHLVEAMIDRISDDFSLPNWINEICKYDTFLYGHCVNVCLLSITFAKWLGWPQSEIRNIGITALMHDIGMTGIPKEIFDKTGTLTEKEFKVIQQHPKLGVQLLSQDISLPINKRCLISVGQHHENCDGSGYPGRLKLHSIDQLARVIRIVDSYEAMTASRIWRNPLSPKEALWTILERCKKTHLYDPHYFKEFILYLTR